MKRITFFILSILCFTACNNDIDITNDIKTAEEVPQIELVMPDAAEVQVYSTATPSESEIRGIWVLVFDGNTLKHSERIDSSRIVKSTRSQALQLLPQLTNVDTGGADLGVFLNGKRIVCIANSGVSTVPSSITPSTINATFNFTKPYYSGGDSLPMYGEFLWPGNFTCEMTRVVAKVQVQMGTSVSDVTGTFDAETVTYSIHNVWNSGQAASAPATGTPVNTSDFSLVQKNNAPQSQTHAYVYETISSASNTTFAANRHHILLRAGAASYYRLDFFAGNEFLNIERNHHYLFTINKVRSAGYATPAEARMYPGGNIEYSINVGDGRYATSNGQYAIVTSVDTLFVPATGTTTITAKIMGEITALPTTNSIAYTAGLTGPASFVAASLAAGQSIAVASSGFSGSGSITFKAGNITHVLPVRAQ